MPTFFRDLRHGLRAIRKSPGFAVAAICVLALGIGANTAIFSAVNAILLRPLPYPEPERLMALWHVPPPQSFPGTSIFSVSPANYLDWHRESRQFESMAAFGRVGLNYSGGDRAIAVAAAGVAPDFFSVMRVAPVLGRAFVPEENQPGRGNVIILGDALWKTQFGSDPGVVGKEVLFNGQKYTVLGVMPRTFRFPDFADAWVPLAWTEKTRAVRDNHNYLVVGRLKPGATIGQAQAEMNTISSRLELEYPADDKGWGAVVHPLRQDLVGDVRPALLVLLGAVAFVLLIACANVANLVLVKTSGRSKEIAIRSALGASRGRILQQILSETLLLAVSGGLLGLVLARISMDFIARFLVDTLPRSVEITLDLPVLAFTLGLSLLTGTLAALLPALRFSRGDVNEALKQGAGRGSSDASGNRTRKFLVVSEVALSLILLVGAGLMIRSLWQLRSVQAGIDPHNVLTADLFLPKEKYSSPALQTAFFNQVLERVARLPGVESAAFISAIPLDGGGSTQPFSLEGQPLLPMSEQPEVAVREISPGYLETMRIPLLRGRDVSREDTADRAAVVLISESMARAYWPGQDPIGRHLTLTFFPGIPRQVVGIVGEVKDRGLDFKDSVPTIYNPVAQVPQPYLSLVTRTAGRPEDAAAAITGVVREMDPGQPVLRISTMEHIVENSLLAQRFIMTLLAAFAALALFLAAVGIYSVLAYTVRRRLREIGIRMALGAKAADVLRMVVLDGMKPTLAGMGIGILGALALGRAVSSMIYGIHAADLATFVAVSALLLAVGLAACALPAYRATQVEPIKTLREE